jgi:hypothetical protein
MKHIYLGGHTYIHTYMKQIYLGGRAQHVLIPGDLDESKRGCEVCAREIVHLTINTEKTKMKFLVEQILKEELQL